jgi:hypothetical protein
MASKRVQNLQKKRRKRSQISLIYMIFFKTNILTLPRPKKQLKPTKKKEKGVRNVEPEKESH